MIASMTSLALCLAAAQDPLPAAPPVTVPAVVLDHAGSPIEGALVEAYRGHRQLICGNTAPTRLWCGITDATGRARVPVLAGIEDAHDGESEGTWRGAEGVVTGLAYLCTARGSANEVGRDVDALDLPAGEVVLRFQVPVCSLRVTVGDPTGRPMQDVHVGVFDTMERSGSNARSPDGTHRTDALGQVVLDGLPVAATRWLAILDPLRAFAATVTPVATPTGAGAEVPVRLTFRGPPATFSGCLADPALAGHRREQVRAVLHDAESDRSRAAPLDGHEPTISWSGDRFAVRAPAWWVEPHGGRLLLIARTPGIPDAWCELALPHAWPHGDADLGAVALRELPLLASGTVIDSVSGAPLAQRDVCFAFTSANGDRQSSVRITTDRDGHFAHYAAIEPGTWTLAIEATQPREFTPGSANLRLPLDPPGRLITRMLFRDGITHADCRVFLRGVASNARSGHDAVWDRRIAIAADGRIEAQDLPPGTLRLSIVGAAELAHFDGLTVKPGEAVVGLPAAIELPAVHLLQLRATDPVGSPIDGFALVCRDARNTAIALTTRNGLIRAVMPTDRFDVYATAPGSRIEHRVFGPGQHRLTLRPTWRLSLRLAPVPQLPPDWQLGANLQYVGTVGEPAAVRGLVAHDQPLFAAFDEAGVLTIEVNAAGPWRVRVDAWDPSRHGTGDWFTLLDGVPMTASDSAEKEIELAIDQQVVAQGLARLGVDVRRR